MVGSEGKTKTVYSLPNVKAQDIIQEEIYDLVEKGYVEIKVEEYTNLFIDYFIEDIHLNMTQEKRQQVQKYTSELLGWTGLGLCDNVSINEKNMKVFCRVIDFDIAQQVIGHDFLNTEFSDYTRIYNENIKVTNIESINNGLPPQIKIPIDSSDYDALEGLRSTNISYLADELFKYFLESDNWDIKNSIAFLVQDLSDNAIIKNILEKSLYSPHEDTKLASIAHLKKDMQLFDRVQIKCEIDSKKLDIEILEYMKSNGINSEIYCSETKVYTSLFKRILSIFKY